MSGSNDRRCDRPRHRWLRPPHTAAVSCGEITPQSCSLAGVLLGKWNNNFGAYTAISTTYVKATHKAVATAIALDTTTYRRNLLRSPRATRRCRPVRATALILAGCCERRRSTSNSSCRISKSSPRRSAASLSSRRMRQLWKLGDLGKHRLTLLPPDLLLALDPFRLFASALGLFVGPLLCFLDAAASAVRSSALSSRAFSSFALTVVSIISLRMARDIRVLLGDTSTSRLVQPLARAEKLAKPLDFDPQTTSALLGRLFGLRELNDFFIATYRTPPFSRVRVTCRLIALRRLLMCKGESAARLPAAAVCAWRRATSS